MKQTHLVLLMADQLRADVLGRGFTPHIDALAAEGASFERAYTACPLCVPARGAFFTGTHPNQNGSLINPWEPRDAAYGQVRAGFDNLYTLLQDEFECIHTGKQHLFTEGGKLEDQPEIRVRWCSTEASYTAYLKEQGVPAPGGPAFRTLVPELVGGSYSRAAVYSCPHTGRYEQPAGCYFDRYFTEQGLLGLRERKGDRPLFLSAMFLAPHPPLEIPEPWYSRVKPEDFTLPENVGQWYPHQSPLQLYNLPGMVGSHYSLDQWRESWRVYLGLVSMLDDCVGELIDELKRQGIYDDSLILFTADHGEMLGSHRLFQKMCMYEESARTPLIVKLPAGEQPAARRYRHVVSHVDVLPTLCERFGLTPRQEMAGRSLAPLLREGDMLGGRAFSQYDGNGSLSNFQRCVIDGPYKLIADLFGGETFFELYHLEKDPQETENLIFCPDGVHDEAAVALSGLLARHMQATGDRLTLAPCRPAELRAAYGDIPAKLPTEKIGK